MAWTLETDPSGFSKRWSNPVAEEYRAQGFWRDETLADIALQRFQSDPDKVLLIEGDNRLTRRDVWQGALTLVAYFQSLGLQSGQVISFQLPNWYETAIIALAARIHGLIINPIPPIYRQAELRYILQDCHSTLLFVPALYRKFDHGAMARELMSQIPDLKQIVVLRGTADDAQHWDRIMNRTPAPLESLPTVAADAIMMVMYTSGTTGKPKGVLHTHYSYDYRVRSMASAWNINANDIIFMPSPVTHITGAFWAFDMPWVCGCASVLLDTWTVTDGMNCIARHQCTVSGGATPFLQQMLEQRAPDSTSLSSLRLFFCGGTTVAPELILRASTQLPECLFFRAYGSTEMPTTTLGIRSNEQAQLGAHTDGEVAYPTRVRIVGAETGTDVPEGEEGEIIAAGPEQFAGYLHPQDNLDLFSHEGFFHTGDLGRWENGHYLVITGRKKDIIIRSGENISPKEVEDVLHGHPAIADVAIVAMPSVATGEKGCAFITLNPGRTLTLTEIQHFLEAAGIARQKIPEHIELVEELPRVPSGKIRKDVLRARAKLIAEAI